MLPACAQAGNKIHCPSHALRVAFDDRGLNYYKGRGFDLDIIKVLSLRSGCQMAFQEMPRMRIFNSIERGDIDVAMFAIETPERRHYAWFAPYMVQKNYVIVSAKGNNVYRTMKEFEADPKALFGVVRGFTHGTNYEAFIARLRAANRLVELTSTDSLFRMVVSNRVQAAMSLPTVIGLYAKDLVPELAGIESHDWDETSPAPAHSMMLAKKSFSDGDAKEWQHLMAEALKDGTIKRIISSYVSGSDLQRSLLK